MWARPSFTCTTSILQKDGGIESNFNKFDFPSELGKHIYRKIVTRIFHSPNHHSSPQKRLSQSFKLIRARPSTPDWRGRKRRTDNTRDHICSIGELQARNSSTGSFLGPEGNGDVVRAVVVEDTFWDGVGCLRADVVHYEAVSASLIQSRSRCGLTIFTELISVDVDLRAPCDASGVGGVIEHE